MTDQLRAREAGHFSRTYIRSANSRSAGNPPTYTATVTKKRDRDRDIVRDLQEDAKWSMWTNTFGRQRGWGRPRSVPHGVGLRTYMLAAIIILGAVVAAIGLIALLLNFD